MSSRIKNTVLWLVLLLAGPVTHAQISKGSFDLGLAGNYFDSPLELSSGGASLQGDHFNLNLGLAGGYFIGENTSVGLYWHKRQNRLEIERQFFNNSLRVYEPYIETENIDLYGVYGRYYIDFNHFLSFFVMANLGVGSSFSSQTQEDSIGNRTTIEWDRDISEVTGGLGVAIRPHQKVGIELSVARRTYTESYLTNNGSARLFETYSGFHFNIGIRLNLLIPDDFKKEQQPWLKE